MQRILDRLMLSEQSEANDHFYLNQYDVQAILYFGKGGMFSDDIKLFQLPTLPDGTLSPEMIEDGILFLRESLRAGRRVLAVGTTGATVIAAYLAEMGMSHMQAMEMIRSANRVPHPDEMTLNRHAVLLQRRAAATVGHKE